MPGRRTSNAAPNTGAATTLEMVEKAKPTELDLLRVEVVLLKRQLNLLKEYADLCVPFGKPHFDRWLAQYKDGARWQE